MNKKKILVVGGAGFIGSLTNQLLNEKGYETVVLDNLSQGHKKCVLAGEFVQGDLGDVKLLSDLFSKHSFTAVMHFAALIDVGESVRDPSKYYENNVMSTLRLIQTMKTHEIKNFIFSSSAAVYGIPQEKYLKEDHPKNPINPYGETKWCVEKILNDFDKAYDFKSISLRYFNAAGGDPKTQIKNYNQKKSNLIPIIVRCLQNNTPLTINGSDYETKDGTCIRDYIHIYDLAVAHILSLEKLLNDNKSTCYNLGNGNGYSILEVIKAAEKVTHKKVQVLKGSRREGDPAYLLADASKAKNELGWQIKYPDLEKMIEHAWNCRTD